MKESPLPILNNEPTRARGLSRRQIMHRLFGTAGTALVLGHTAEAADTADGEDSKNAAPDWQPVFFDAHQNQTLIVLADRILPNSTQAQVNRFIDTLISVDTQENQKKFLASLGAFDHEGITRYNQPFKALTEEQQNDILAAASVAPPAEAGQGGRKKRRPTVPTGSEAPALTFHDHFENIKGWVSGAFYSSEFGMKELGWTGQVAWESLPGCPGPEGHA